MIQIRILLTGKHKASWIDEAYTEFKKRLSKTILLEEVWLKSEKELLERLSHEKELILLDPDGHLFDSQEFAAFLQKKGARLTFAIGGAHGFPDEVKKRYNRLSLSPLTFSHQITRLILLEQLFRAHEIWRNSPYPK
jgi:23S rRNA (pseudouridine1915-N3)-methyltransferase